MKIVLVDYIMERFFRPDKFNIVNDDGYYIISTKDKKCLCLTVYEHTIEVVKLDKCQSNGTLLLKMLEEYAKSVGIREINLQDESKINTNCVDYYGKEISIDLASLKLLTTGKSWYNSLGYFSSRDNTEETEKVANSSCIEAIYSSKDDEIDEILWRYSIEELEKIKARYLSVTENHPILVDTQYQIDNNEEFIAKEIENVELETLRIIDGFTPADLNLTVREYLISILPIRVGEESNCQQYEFIRDFINFISPLLNYDNLLTKILQPSGSGGRKKKRRFTKNCYRNDKRLKSKKN